MSEVIDNKVVSMEFDNQNFEKNVKTTMSTLDKLKEALNFKSAGKAFDDLGKAADKVNMNGLTNAIDNVKSRFSVLEVAGITAIANLTNSAVNQGKRLVKALSVDQVTAGWSKFEAITGSTQTIMSATGKSIEEVEKQIDKLNWFTDETSYNLTDMTDNIGKFTSAGVDLDKAVTAMEGIATEAALSGANTQQASRAMYNFSQAMGTGAVKLQDWMSIENANMATKEFKETIIATAEALGTIKKGSVTFENFRDNLKDGWFTSDVLIQALNKYGGFADKLEASMKETTLDMTSEMLRYVDQFIDGTIDMDAAAAQAGVSTSKLKSILTELGSSEYELGRRAFKAAQEAKTFTDAINATKDAVSTSFMNTFKIIFGNYEQAKVMWTDLANDLWEIFAGPIQNGNEILAGAFDSPWGELKGKIEDAAGSADEFLTAIQSVAKSHNIDISELTKKYGSLEKAINAGAVPAKIIREAFDKFTSSAKTATKTTKATADELKKFQKIVNQVIRGDFGNGEARIKALTKAGWDYKEVQSLVNKQLKNGKITLNDLSTTQLKSVGYTDEQIKKIRELGDEAANSDSDIAALLETIDRPSGRQLFTETLSNSLHAVMEVIDDVKEAWNGENGVFTKTTSEQIYNVIKAINEFSNKALKGLEDRSDKIQRSLKGVFAVIDLVGYVAKTVLTSTLRTVSGLFSGTGDKILDMTANMGDGVVGFVKYIKETDRLGKTLTKLSDRIIETKNDFDSFKEKVKENEYVKKASEALKKFKDALDFKDFKGFGKVFKFDELFEKFQNIGKKAKKIFSDIGDYIKNSELGSKIIEKFSNTFDKLSEKVKNFVYNIFADFLNLIYDLENNDNGFDGLVEAIQDFSKALLKDIFGIETDSLDLKSVLEGFRKAIREKLEDAGEAILSFGDRVSNTFDRIKKIFDEDIDIDWVDVVSIGMGIGLIKTLENVTNILTKIETFVQPLKAFSDVLVAVKGLVGSLSGAISGITAYIKSQQISNSILKIAGAVGILAVAITLLTFVVDKKEDAFWKATTVIGGLVVLLTGLFAVLTLMSKSFENLNFKGLAILFGTLAAMLLALAASMYVVAKIPATSVVKAGGALTVMLGVMIGATYLLMKLNKTGTKAKRSMEAIRNVALVMLAAAATLKIVSSIDAKKGAVGLGLMTGVIILMSGLMAATMMMNRKNGSKSRNIGKEVAMIGATMLELAAVLHIISLLNPKKAITGITLMTGLIIEMVALMAATNLLGKNSKGEGKFGLIELAGSLILIAVAMKILEDLDPEKSLNTAITTLGLITALGVVAWALSKFAGDKGSGKAGLMLVGLAASLFIIAAAMHVLEKLDQDKLLATAGTTVALILALSVAMIAASKVPGAGALKTFIPVITVFGAAVAAIYLLSGKVDQAIKIAESMAILIGTFAGAILVAGISGTPNKGVIKNLLFIAVVAVAVGFAMAAMQKYVGENMGNGWQQAANAISTFIGAMTLVTAAFGSFSIDPSAVFKGCVGLLIVLATVAVAVVAAGALVLGIGSLLNTKFVNWKENLDTAITFLDGLLTGLGGAIGNGIINTFKTITAGLVVCGENLSLFMANMTGFFTGLVAIKNMDLIAPLSVLTDVIDTFTSKKIEKVGNAEDMADLADKIKSFITSFSEAFSGEVTLPDPSVLAGIDTCMTIAGKISDFSQGLKPIKPGVLQKLFGDNTLSAFISQLEPFATGLVTFSQTVNAEDAINSKGIESVLKTAGKIVDFAANLPVVEGGLLQKITGDNSIAEFTVQLGLFADGMIGFSTAITQNPLDDAAITTALATMSKVVDFAKELPPASGWIGKLTGTDDQAMDLDTFASQLKKLGTGLKDFSKSLSDDKFSTDNIDNGVSAIQNIADNMLPKIPTSDIDTSKLKTFLESLAEILTTFSNGVREKKYDAETVASAVNSTATIVSLINSIPTETVDLTYFKQSVDDLALALTNMTTTLNGVDTKALSKSVKAIMKALSGFNDMGEILKGVSENGKNVITTFTTGITNGQAGLVNSFKNVCDAALKKAKSYETSFNSQGKSYTTKVSEGIKNNPISFGNTFLNAVIAAKKYQGYNTQSNGGNTFYAAGYYCVAGFCNAINQNKWRVTAAGTALGNAAFQAAKTAIDSNSPSKKFHWLGMMSILGFVNCINQNLDMPADAGTAMGTSAMNALSNAVSMANDIVEEGINHSPVITPLVDTSQLAFASGQISSYLNQNGAYYRTGLDLSGRMSARSIELRGIINDNMIDKETFNSALNDLGSEISELRNDIRNMKVVLSTGQTVGGLLPEIDRGLKMRQKHKERGM